jgi:hypothetical protein
MKFRLPKKKKAAETEGTPVKGGLAERLQEGRAKAEDTRTTPKAPEGPQTPDAADDMVEEAKPRAYGTERPAEAKAEQPPEPTVQAVEMVRVVPEEPSTESASVTVERRKSLPILRTGTVDLAAERGKLDKIPKFQCSTCAIGVDCPEYKEGYVCAFNTSFDAFPVRDADSVMELMKKIVDTNKKRMFRALLSEELVSGGQLDANVTRQTQVVMQQLTQLVELSRDTDRVTVQVQGDKAVEKGGGILQKLFGGGGSTAQEKGDVLTITPEVEAGGRPSWEPEVVTQEDKMAAEDVAADDSQENLEEAPNDP